MNWILIPFRNRWDLTQVAVEDSLNQQGLDTPPQVLLIDTSGDVETRRKVEAWMERQPRLHAWFHTPALPSLAAIWNLGLRFVWQQGGKHALVVNNDVRLHLNTYEELRFIQQAEQALFVSAVGRREHDMDWVEYFAGDLPVGDLAPSPGNRGGPDYSCFLITRDCHDALRGGYSFDEGFIPAYCEDCDHHRRLMLGGDGHRIFSVNLPYLHYGSATVNAEVTQREAWAKQLQRSRDYYRMKWGGEVNAERYTIPFDESTAQDGVTNPELQRRINDAPTAEAL